MSERECVMDYLWTRVLAAWAEGEDEEAMALNEFHGELGAMTDEQYGTAYDAPLIGDIA